jgi:nitrous oxidase accessory protein NosD
MKTRLVVSTAGQGSHRSIAAAIQAAPAGAEIRIQPGRYREGLILDKPLTLRGEGARQDIIVESARADCIRIAAEGVVVRGLTLRCQVPRRGQDFHAVNVPQGQVLLEDCDITCNSLACVALHREGQATLKK